MLKTFMTMVVVAVIFYSGQVFAQSQGSDSIPTIIHTDSIGGVKVEYDEYGSWLRMRTTGEAELPFGSPSDIRRAKKKSILRAKAALVKFMKETITSSEHLEDVANTISNEQRKGGKYSKDVLRKTLEDESEMISGSADGILRGIIVLEEKVDKNNQNVWVTLGVSRKTVKAAAGLKKSINNPESGSQRSTTYQMKDPLEDGGVIIRRSRNFDNF